MRIFPILNNVYYEWLDIADKIGDIYIPTGAGLAMRKAIIHETGPTCELVKPGDKVLTWKHTGTHLFLCQEDKWTDGERHRMCREDEFVSHYRDDADDTTEIIDRQEKTKKEFLEEQRKKKEG